MVKYFMLQMYCMAGKGRYKTWTLDWTMDWTKTELWTRFWTHFQTGKQNVHTNLMFPGLPTVHFLITYSLVPKVVIIQISMDFFSTCQHLRS